MDRRRFLTFLWTLMLGLGCQSPPARGGGAAASAEQPRAVPTLAFPKPREADATLGVAEEQSRVIRVPQDRPLAYSTRTIPPERLVIPTIGLDAKVVPLGTKIERGVSVWETAAFAVGHHRGSGNPGEPGNIVLSGHISSPAEGAVFKRLPDLKVGDGVIVVTAQQHFVYLAREIQVVRPSAVEVIDATSTPVATLITCVPDGVYTHRLIVRCEAV